MQVHCAAISGQSTALDVLMNGRMKEAQTRSATLPDVQLEDFVLFCQFAYRGDYTPPLYRVDESACKGKNPINKPEKGAATQPLDNPDEADKSSTPSTTLQSSSRSISSFQDWSGDGNPVQHAFFQTGHRRRILKDIQSFEIFLQEDEVNCVFQEEHDDSEYTTDSDEESDDDSEGFIDKLDIKEVKGLMADNKNDLPKHVQLRRDFLAQNFLRGRVRDCLAMECGVTPNRTAEEDYTPVFLGHARLYVFAEKYGASTLRALALSKLHRTLTYFTIFKERIGDVIALVRYAYSNENTPDYDSEIVDDLRRLVTQYVVCEFRAFANTEQFCSLLEEGGPFVRDWWNLVRKYQL